MKLPAMPPDLRVPRRDPRAFTLMEIMVVVGIMGLVAAMGIPSMLQAFKKEGMRKAVDDMVDVMHSARERAIYGNKTVAVIFYPREGRFGVEGADARADTVLDAHTGEAVVSSLPKGVNIAMLDIFRKEYRDSDWAKIFFHADGTCDEAVIILEGRAGTKPEKITLEYATGLPVVNAVNE